MSGVFNSKNSVSVNNIKNYLDDYIISGRISAYEKLKNVIPSVKWLMQAQKDAVLKSLSDIPSGMEGKRALIDRILQEIVRDPVNEAPSSDVTRVMKEQAWAIQSILSFLRLADLSRARAVQRSWYANSNTAREMCMRSQRGISYETLSQNARFRGLTPSETLSYYPHSKYFGVDDFDSRHVPSLIDQFMAQDLAQGLRLHCPELQQMQIYQNVWHKDLTALATCCASEITWLSLWPIINFTRVDFDTILKAHIKLETLHLGNIRLEQQDFQLLEQFPSSNLKGLAFVGGTIEMGTLVGIVQARSLSLQSLTINGMSESLQMTSDHFKLIGDACPELQSFEWRQNHQNGEEGIIQLIQRCKKLKDLRLERGFTNRMLFAIGKHCPLLDHLKFDNHGKTTTSYGCVALLQGCSMLDSESSADGVSIREGYGHLLSYEGRSPLSKFYLAAVKQREDAKKLFSALDVQLQNKICFNVWDVGGRQQGDPEWGRNHLLDIDVHINRAIIQAMRDWYAGVSIGDQSKYLAEQLDKYWDATGR